MIKLTRYALVLALSVPGLAAHAQQWTVPTPEELAMTSIPEVPGAAAVYLYQEETTEDSLRMFSHYVRLKVLNERGKEYANVELPYSAGATGARIDSIAGRTIHPDGSITPFTGKPFEKMIEKTQGFKVMSKVFTLPAVEVGSILEYRYKMHYDDFYFIHPDWYLQSDLYVKKAHYFWRPTQSTVITSDDRGEVLSSVAWTPILPPGAKVVETAIPGSTSVKLELDVHDIPPLPHEQYMPPMNSLSYRVLFYYTSYKTVPEFWNREGKRWAKTWDKFIGPQSGVEAAAKELVAPSDTQDQKLRKLYAAVMKLDNTDFSREHTTSEEKAAGLKMINSAEDVLARKRGSGDQMAELFVSLARASGMKAYLMAVTNRRERVFLASYLNVRQLDDFIAIVNVNGKDMFFDPGQRFCAYGQLAWNHTLTSGLRQTDGGVELAMTVSNSYHDDHVGRVADLALDEQGVASGTVTITEGGNSALHWRQQGIRGDDTSLNAALRSDMESMLPGGMEVRVTNVENLADGEKPLVLHYQVKGAVGSSTGKRLLIPANIFEAGTKPKFPESKRELLVDLRYASYVQDAIRFRYPASLTIESAPPPQQDKLKNLAGFTTSSKQAPAAITLYRNVTVGTVYFTPAEYPDLRAFYSKLEATDQESVVLTRAAEGVVKASVSSN